jgi:hypothetical protein
VQYLQLLAAKVSALTLGPPSAIWALVLIVFLLHPRSWDLLSEVVARLKEMRFLGFRMTFVDPPWFEGSPKVEERPAPKAKRRKGKSKGGMKEGGDQGATSTGGQP